MSEEDKTPSEENDLESDNTGAKKIATESTEGRASLFSVPEDEDATIIFWAGRDDALDKNESVQSEAVQKETGESDAEVGSLDDDSQPDAVQVKLPEEDGENEGADWVQASIERVAKEALGSGDVSSGELSLDALPVSAAELDSALDVEPIVEPAHKTESASATEPELEPDDDRTIIVRPEAVITQAGLGEDLGGSSSDAVPAEVSEQSEPEIEDDRTRIVRPVTSTTAPEVSESPSGFQQVSPLDSQLNYIYDTTGNNAITGGNFGAGANANTSADKNIINNRFELQEILGSGGMGTVYKAVDRRKVEAQERDPYVAVKVLNDDFKNHPLAFISLQRETRKTQTLAHPNIVNVHDFDRDQDRVFMTMEYLEGDALDKVLADNRVMGLEQTVAVSILKSMCGALIYAHSHNIAHSDFKPGNVFITNQGENKVFDFGIARAVSQVEESEQGAPSEHELTKFDPGNLGALTPAYASLEMLEGQVPDIRDDIYALGCVAYELFTGGHPFAKVPANEAAAKGLKPVRIKKLPRRQWRVIERSLAFTRDQRIPSVEEFWQAFEPRSSVPWWTGGIAAVAILAVGFLSLDRGPEIDEQELRKGIRSDVATEVEAEVKLNIARTALETLLQNVELNEVWEQQVETAFKDYRVVAGNNAPWLARELQKVSVAYLVYSGELVQEGKLPEAERALAKADAWTVEIRNLEQAPLAIVSALSSDREALMAEFLNHRQQLEAQQQEITRLEEELVATQLAKKAAERKRIAKAKAVKRYNKALADLNSSAECKGGIDFAVIRTKLKAYKRLAGRRYSKQQTIIANGLASCLNRVAQQSPSTAERMKVAAVNLFPKNKLIESVKIDYCVTVKPTSGSSSSGVCQDRMRGGGSAPKLVVVPGPNGDKIAVGKFEISIAEMNEFCEASRSCPVVLSRAGDLPASNFSFKRAEQYIDWLTLETGFDYRIPSLREWRHFASAAGKADDPNRNCTLSVRGIVRGLEPVNVTSGKPNSWGLINHVGNVQEWATKRGDIFALGGNHTDPISACNVRASRRHKGKADVLTGLRVIRTI